MFSVFKKAPCGRYTHVIHLERNSGNFILTSSKELQACVRSRLDIHAMDEHDTFFIPRSSVFIILRLHCQLRPLLSRPRPLKTVLSRISPISGCPFHLLPPRSEQSSLPRLSPLRQR